MFRWSDDQNYWMITPGSGTTDKWMLRKRVANVNSIVYTSDVTPATGDRVSVVFNGSSISLYVNDVLKTTVTDSFNSSAIQCGLQGSFSVDPTTKWGYGTSQAAWYFRPI